MGLPLSQGLMKLHDGSLELETTPGKGTIVSLKLPKNRVNVDGATSGRDKSSTDKMVLS